MNQLDGEHPQQRDLRIGHVRDVECVGQRLLGCDPALGPHAGRRRSSLKLVDIGVDDARGEQEDRIVGFGRERRGPLRHVERRCVFGAQAQHEAEPVQQESAHRMRFAAEQRVRALEGALCFAARAERLHGRHAAQRGERDLHRVALRPRGGLPDDGQRALREAQAGRGAQLPQRRLRGLGVAAQRGHRLPSPVEVHCQLRRGDRQPRGTLPFQRSAYLGMELGTGRRRRTLVRHLAEQRMPERIRQLHRIAASPRGRSGEPELLARQFVTGLADNSPHRDRARARASQPGTRPRRPPPRTADRAARFPAWPCSDR